jgi:nicotinate-nucleotide adenylyltransferase
VRTGVLGGTFDPPHAGHLRLAEAAHEQLRLDAVLFVPAGEPYRKADRLVSPSDVRMRLVEAATMDLPWATVSAVEVDRHGPSYTVETLEVLTVAGGDWWFIAGADVLLDLPQWHRPQRIIELARLAIAVRPPRGKHVPARTRAALPGIEARIDWLALPPLDISSSDLRRRIAEGASTEGLLPPRVRALIDELRLYRD